MLLILIGLISGIIGGMGMGGGTILIPALIFFAHISQHIAQGVNLSVFFPISVAALIIHTRNGHVRYKLAIKIALMGVAGALIGSLIAVSISINVLGRIFGSFILIMGFYELFRKAKDKGK